MKKIKITPGSLLLMSLPVAAVLSYVSGDNKALAAPLDPRSQALTNRESIIVVGDGETDRDSIVVEILRWLVWAAVALSIVMIIVGGIRYVLSSGNQEKVTAAQKTILYSVIGLAVAILAGVIVNFVLVNILNGITNGDDGGGAGGVGN